MGDKLSRNQWRIFFICFLGYSSAYLARLNLSAALNSLMESMSLSDAQGGLLQTVYALIYAGGQMVNGMLVDRVSARRHIFLGLLCSGICNLAFGLSNAYWQLLILWGLNGAAQSMLWTPVVKVMAVWFKGAQRTKTTFGISMTMTLGNLGAWAISGYFASTMTWRLSFIIPAVWVAVISVLVLIFLRDHPAEGEYIGKDDAPVPVKTAGTCTSMPLGMTFCSTGLLFVLAFCVLDGFVRDGIITWSPTIIAKVGNAQTINSTLSTLLIPALNLLGVLCANRMYIRLGSNARLCVAVFMLTCAVFSVVLFPASANPVALAVILGLCCASVNGTTPMITQLIPMEYERAGRVGLVAGMVDCFIYLGSALAGVVTGSVSDHFGWMPVFGLWCGVALVCGFLAFLSIRGIKKLQTWVG